MAEIRRPNITAATADGQLSQIKSYLYQLTNQLNFALKAAEDTEKANGAAVPGSLSSGAQSGKEALPGTAESRFTEVKSLIIKSADIVNAYYDIIEQRLSGIYTAESDFGTFKEEISSALSATSERIDQSFSSLQQIDSKIDGLSELRRDSFYVRTGWLYENADGSKTGGIELGQVSEDGEGIKSAFARFTPDELAFYGEDGVTKLGSFSNYKLNIYEARIEGNLGLGNYMLDTKNGIAFKWTGE